MSRDITLTARYWLERVLSCLGLTDSERQDCVTSASVALGDVVIVFLQPHYAERTHVVARALVGTVPPEGQCEPLFQMALEVQGMMCGPYVPVLCLDWPARTLMVSSSLDSAVLAADDAAQILVGMRDTARQWRNALAAPAGASAGRAEALFQR